MIHFYRGEEFKEIKLHHPLKLRYAISNHGRLVSFIDTIKEGTEFNSGLSLGYKAFQYGYSIGGVKKSVCHFFYRLVAEYFIPKENEDQTYVLHLDFDKTNDHINNLRWANKKELIQHHRFNPKVIKGREKTTAHNIKADGRKLTSTQVIRIKKMLQREDNKTRLVMIAKQFNITTQQLYRIRTGENWGHIKI